MRAPSSFEASLLRGLGGFMAPGGKNASLLVLIYHRVLETPDPLLETEPDIARFSAEMDLVRSVANVLPLAEAAERLARGDLPPRALCVTFDDGYVNNRTVAAPILKARGVPATVFVATGFIDTGRMWNDTVIESVRYAGEYLDLRSLELGEYRLTDTASRRRAFEEILRTLKHRDPEARLRKVEEIAAHVGLPAPRNVMMNEQQIRELPDFGIEVGAHTVMHPILKAIAPDVAKREILESKHTLESILGRQVTLFAYPNGRPNRDYEAVHVEQVRDAGFAAAVSTAWGAANRSTDRFQIPRMLPWDRTPLRFGARLLRTYRQQSAEIAA
jgi:peptidoglycan/xylan/chitin deacetylase (PgdA/CDA1 family)